jgi:hypothetical protein
MKTRNGFVSNSSSSSFVVKIDALSLVQRAMILNHADATRMLHQLDNKVTICEEGDQWDIKEEEGKIIGSTWMDNFDMQQFMQEIGVPMHAVEWDGENRYDYDR